MLANKVWHREKKGKDEAVWTTIDVKLCSSLAAFLSFGLDKSNENDIVDFIGNRQQNSRSGEFPR
jgi:hypothetical protein